MIGEWIALAIFCAFSGFLFGFYVVGFERDEEIKKRIETEKEIARWEGYLDGYDAALAEIKLRETIERQLKEGE